MAIYTGVADANGDFNIPFSANYTSGQKVTVTAEKDAATKSIELYAPSDVIGGGNIQFSGNMTNFPNNIGVITLTGITTVAQNSFYTDRVVNVFFRKATGLILDEGTTSVGIEAFLGWDGALSLSMPNSLSSIGSGCFRDWINATSITWSSSLTQIPEFAFYNWRKLVNLIIPTGVTVIGAQAFNNCISLQSIEILGQVTTIGAGAFANLTACNIITLHATTPPTIQSNTFVSLKSTCIFKVPAESVAAYQAAPNWSAFASRIQAI